MRKSAAGSAVGNISESITYSEEAELLGSAGGVQRMRHFFGNDPVLIVHGDILFDVDLSAVIQYHLSRAALATIVLHPAHTDTTTVRSW